jgi:hypothetical protein
VRLSDFAGKKLKRPKKNVERFLFNENKKKKKMTINFQIKTKKTKPQNTPLHKKISFLNKKKKK